MKFLKLQTFESELYMPTADQGWDGNGESPSHGGASSSGGHENGNSYSDRNPTTSIEVANGVTVTGVDPNGGNTSENTSIELDEDRVPDSYSDNDHEPFSNTRDVAGGFLDELSDLVDTIADAIETFLEDPKGHTVDFFTDTDGDGPDQNLAGDIATFLAGTLDNPEDVADVDEDGNVIPGTVDYSRLAGELAQSAVTGAINNLTDPVGLGLSIALGPSALIANAIAGALGIEPSEVISGIASGAGRLAGALTEDTADFGEMAAEEVEVRVEEFADRAEETISGLINGDDSPQTNDDGSVTISGQQPTTIDNGDGTTTTTTSIGTVTTDSDGNTVAATDPNGTALNTNSASVNDDGLVETPFGTVELDGSTTISNDVVNGLDNDAQAGGPGSNGLNDGSDNQQNEAPTSDDTLASGDTSSSNNRPWEQSYLDNDHREPGADAAVAIGNGIYEDLLDSPAGAVILEQGELYIAFARDAFDLTPNAYNSADYASINVANGVTVTGVDSNGGNTSENTSIEIDGEPNNVTPEEALDAVIDSAQDIVALYDDYIAQYNENLQLLGVEDAFDISNLPLEMQRQYSTALAIVEAQENGFPEGTDVESVLSTLIEPFGDANRDFRTEMQENVNASFDGMSEFQIWEQVLGNAGMTIVEFDEMVDAIMDAETPEEMTSAMNDLQETFNVIEAAQPAGVSLSHFPNSVVHMMDELGDMYAFMDNGGNALATFMEHGGALLDSISVYNSQMDNEMLDFASEEQLDDMLLALVPEAQDIVAEARDLYGVVSDTSPPYPDFPEGTPTEVIEEYNAANNLVIISNNLSVIGPEATREAIEKFNNPTSSETLDESEPVMDTEPDVETPDPDGPVMDTEPDVEAPDPDEPEPVMDTEPDAETPEPEEVNPLTAARESLAEDQAALTAFEDARRDLETGEVDITPEVLEAHNELVNNVYESEIVLAGALESVADQTGNAYLYVEAEEHREAARDLREGNPQAFGDGILARNDDTPDWQAMASGPGMLVLPDGTSSVVAIDLGDPEPFLSREEGPWSMAANGEDSAQDSPAPHVASPALITPELA